MLDPQSAERGARIGRYRIVRKIAEGGMGSVFEAEQESPRRTVALKVIRPGSSTPELLRRFEHEAQILGRLQHPGIAQIYEAGSAETSAGVQPFFAMELVRGLPLVRHAQERALDTRARLELVARVCDAVHHAHQKGVIHRDLKPGNILVDESGQPKVLDFGIARLTDSDIRTTTLHTATGQLLGTLPYMSPEQVAADPLEIDTRSDVYALGVILYELLCGKLPYELGHKSIPEAARIIREVEPTSLGSHSRVYRGDLETIVAKALEKDRTRRYGSAAELGADIERHLRDEPIVARPPSALYQLVKFARRNRVLVGGVAAVFLALATGLVLTTRQAVRATRAEKLAGDRLVDSRAAEALAEERRADAESARALAETRAEEARRAAARAEYIRAFLERMLQSASPKVADGRKITVREVLDTTVSEIDGGSLGDDPEVEAYVRRVIGGTYRALGDMSEAERHLRRTLDIFSGLHAADHMEIARSRDDLAVALCDLGRVDEAEELLLPALETHRRLDGEESEEVSMDLSLLAVIRYNQGRFDEAEELDERALAMLRRLGGNDQTRAHALTQLAFRKLEQRDSAAAEPLLREALDILRRDKGSDHVSLIRPTASLGRTLDALGRNDEAEEQLTEALRIATRVYGPSHLETADVQASLGGFYADNRDFERAEPLLRASLEIRRRELHDHKDVATSLTLLAELLAQRGEQAEAEALVQESLEMRRRVFGDVSIAVGDSLRRLGWIRRSTGDFDEAERLFAEAIAVWRETLGSDHTDLAYVLRDLGLMVSRRGDLAGAEPLLREALAIRRTGYGERHRRTLESRDDLIVLLLARESWSEARALVEETLALAEQDRAPEHVLLAHLRIQLGAALAGEGRFEEAEPLMLAGWERIAGDERLWAETKLQAIGHIERLYRAWGRTEEADGWLARRSAYER